MSEPIIGTVFRVFDPAPTAKKHKRFVIVGISVNEPRQFAVVYINSEINPNVIRTDRLRDLQVELGGDNTRKYLDHTSYADCSVLKVFTKAGVENHLRETPGEYLGQMSVADLSRIVDKIRTASTIASLQRAFFQIL